MRLLSSLPWWRAPMPGGATVGGQHVFLQFRFVHRLVL